MRTIMVTAATAALLGACAHGGGTAVSVSASGVAPAAAPYRFLASPPGERPGDFLVRSQIQARLAAGGFVPSAEAPHYLVETAVVSRPPQVGAFAGEPGPQPAWRVAPAARGGPTDRVCQVSLRFIDAASGAEAWRVEARRQGPVEDCNTENFRLVDAALKGLGAAR